MLKLFLIYLSQANWARQIVQRWSFAKKTAARFVAGETLDEAVAVVKKLHQRGIATTLDHLGENVIFKEDAFQAADEVLEIISKLKQEGVRSGISIKLSQIGLVLDREVCQNNLIRILESARENEIFIRVDMEDSSFTDATLEIFYAAWNNGFENYIGIVIQSSLYRSIQDVKNLLAEQCRIRICKGAYKEHRSIAYPQKKSVDENFDRITDLLIEQSKTAGSLVSADGGFPPIPAIATHDQDRIEYALEYARKIGLDKTGLEIQMLYGIREDLQEDLVNREYPVRVYVPYGKEWYPYFVRRLAERPANLWFFLTNLVRLN